MKYYENQKGWIEAIVGPMFAGKTEELIRRVKRMEYAHKNYLIFKPSIDNRYSIGEIVSHNKKALSAINIEHSKDIKKCLKPETQAVVIDEVQFFDDDIVDVIKNLAEEGYRVICGGLDCDFRGEPFMIVANILALSEDVTKLTAICQVCGALATKTQRIINGKAAYYDDPIILVGEKEAYEARCRNCHTVLKHE